MRFRQAIVRALLGLAALAGLAPAASADLLSATLPGSRSLTTGAAGTVFATMLNTGATALNTCTVALADAPAGLTLSFQTVTAANVLTGAPADAPFDIAAGGSQGLLLAFIASSTFSGQEVSLRYACNGGSVVAPVTIGVNTVFLSASATAQPDIIPIAVTPSNDGVIRIATPGGPGLMAAAAVNIGPSATLTVRPSSGGAALGAVLAICETNPTTGACLAPLAESVTVDFATGVMRTFSVFTSATWGVPFLPDILRVRLTFATASGALTGLTSAAITAPPTSTTLSNNGIYRGTINGKPGFMGIMALPVSFEYYYIGGQTGANSDVFFGRAFNFQSSPPTELTNRSSSVSLGGEASQVASLTATHSPDLSFVGVDRYGISPNPTLADFRLAFDPATTFDLSLAGQTAPDGTYDIFYNGTDIGELVMVNGTDTGAGSVTWPGGTRACTTLNSLVQRGIAADRNVWRFNFWTVVGGTGCTFERDGLGYAEFVNGKLQFQVMSSAQFNFIQGNGFQAIAGEKNALHLTLVKR